MGSLTGAGERFRDAVLAGDLETVEALLSEDVQFRSPAVFKPYQGRTATMVILRSVLRIAEDFRYTRSFTEVEGRRRRADGAQAVSAG